MTLDLETSAFEPGGAIPERHTCDGGDVSPALSWSAPPAGARSLALVCDDPDAPRGTWVHWVLYNLPAGTQRLDEGVPATAELPSGARQGRNDFRRIGYGGPCPPPGPPHRYYFRLYALDVVLALASGATRKDLDRAMKGHVLADAELMGRYQR